MKPEELERFKRRLEEALESARKNCKPSIVLLGPGRHAKQGFWKRKKIKEYIKEESPNAAVVFPEKAEQAIPSPPFVRGVKDAALINEDFLCSRADLIVALDIDDGAGQEVASYSNLPRFKDKLIVIAHNSRALGYTGLKRSSLEVRYFSNDQIKNCDQVSEYCRNAIRAWLIKKILA